MTFAIPPLTAAKLKELAARIVPLVERDGALWYIEPVDLTNVAFSWDPKLVRKAEGLTPIGLIRTLHTYGYYGMFKPSIAEVLAQIPESYLEKTVAFRVVGPDTADDLNREKEALNAGFHVAETTLYAGAVVKPGKATVLDKIAKVLG